MIMVIVSSSKKMPGTTIPSANCQESRRLARRHEANNYKSHSEINSAADATNINLDPVCVNREDRLTNWQSRERLWSEDLNNNRQQTSTTTPLYFTCLLVGVDGQNTCAESVKKAQWMTKLTVWTRAVLLHTRKRVRTHSVTLRTSQ